jgi:hypothetical protein
VRATIGSTLQALGRYAEAEPNLRKSLAIRRAALHAGHPDIAISLNNLSVLLTDQKKHAEAEPLLLAGYEGLKQRETTIQQQGKIRLTEALERLVQLYTDWHAAEPDKAYDAKAAEWQTKLNEFKASQAAEKPASTPDK